VRRKKSGKVGGSGKGEKFVERISLDLLGGFRSSRANGKGKWDGNYSRSE